MTATALKGGPVTTVQGNRHGWVGKKEKAGEERMGQGNTVKEKENYI